MTTRLVAGCMTGTSIDALDCALVRIDGVGLEISAEFVAGATVPLGGLTEPLRRLASQEPMPIGTVALLARDLAILHADALRDLIGGEQVDLVSVHGQTVFHQPPLSLQLINPTVIAQALGISVVTDLRAADIAREGQGAPMSPLADWVLFHHDDESRSIVNLGGFANVTHLPAGGTPEDLSASDLCACNQLLNQLARDLLGEPYDRDGAVAESGEANAPAKLTLLNRLREQASSGRSLGTGDELHDWIREHESLDAPVVLRSGVDAIGELIGDETRDADVVALAGGSVANRALVGAIERATEAKVCTTDDLSVPHQYREAVAMGILGILSRDRVPITLPQVTGCRQPSPIAGVWVEP